MKTRKNLLFLFFIMFLTIFTLPSCAQQQVSSKTFRVPAFNAIKSDAVANIHLRQGSTISVRVEGDKELMNRLDLHVRNGKLMIDMDNGNFFKRFRIGRKKLNMYITTPDLTSLETEGVGNITMEGNFRVPSLRIISDGVGNITAEHLNCGDITVDSDGVGNITLNGKAENVAISSDGVGNVNTEKLLASEAQVNSSGVGNVRCYARKTITIRSSGVGNVTYYGNPSIKNVSKDGVGHLRSGD